MHKLTPKETTWMAKPLFWSTIEELSGRICYWFWILQHNLIQYEHHLPTIEELLSTIQGFEFVSCINLNMGSLSLPVNKENKMLFMIVMTESMCKCTVLAMYPCPSSGIFQSCMVFILIQMDCNWWPKSYLDNIFSGKGKDFDKHLDVWNKIFTIMEIHRMQVNLAKS